MNLQFPTVGPLKDCPFCHPDTYRPAVLTCEECGEAYTDDVAPVHGLDPLVGETHMDVCSSCLALMRREGQLA